LFQPLTGRSKTREKLNLQGLYCEKRFIEVYLILSKTG